MIQFNLLPEIKQDYVKSVRTKRLVMTIASIAAVVSIAVAIILYVSVNVVQKDYVNNLNGQISTNTSKLKNTPNLTQILNIQNQVGSLETLHESKAVALRLFGYISDITPANATISSLTINFPANSISLTGQADTLATINKFVDTMIFSTYQVSGQSSTSQKDAFSNTQLTSFSYTSSSSPAYTITATFDPTIFNDANDVTLTVPNLITTRSVLDQPKILFQAAPSQTISSSTSSQ
ncbi:MAG TPA: hypothetical protein VMR34_04240 [Candidatus Saccharimonadales bacterium]|nr:hypothetical protein [Candidatus Saccharimonadales bacterium]